MMVVIGTKDTFDRTPMVWGEDRRILILTKYLGNQQIGGSTWKYFKVIAIHAFKILNYLKTLKRTCPLVNMLVFQHKILKCWGWEWWEYDDWLWRESRKYDDERQLETLHLNICLFLHSEASSWFPQSSAVTPPSSCSAQRPAAAAPCLNTKIFHYQKIFQLSISGCATRLPLLPCHHRIIKGKKLEVSPIVSAFLWCALAEVPAAAPPSRHALLMLLDMEAGKLVSSPPDRDSKLDCMNLSLLPTWSTLSMLQKTNIIKKYFHPMRNT